MNLGLGLSINQARSASAPAFVGPLDALVSQGAVLMGAFSTRRLLSSYTGTLARLRGDGTGSPEADIGYLSDGSLDKAAVASLIANGSGSAAFWRTIKDQTGVFDAEQTSASNQPQYSEVSIAAGAIGGRASAQSNCFLVGNLETIPQPCTFFVVVHDNIVTNRAILGTSATTKYIIRTSASTIAQHWGSVFSAANFSRTGKVCYTFISNGASSKSINALEASTTGNAGGTQLGMSSWRLGMADITSRNWLNTAGNAIAEIVVFNGDPTGLAGWSTFRDSARNYFGTA